VASSSTGALDEGRRLAKRAHEIAETTGSLTDLASGYVADAYAADPDKELALESFMIADRLARSAGNRWMSAFARTEAAGILICTGRVADACTSLAEVVDLWYRAGDWSQQWHTLSRCMLALDEIGCPEIAAEACGAIDAHATMGAPPSMPAMTAVAFATRDALVHKLGEEQTQLRRGMGASRPLVETIERVRSALLGRSLHT
jgi:hypothetical protein